MPLWSFENGIYEGIQVEDILIFYYVIQIILQAMIKLSIKRKSFILYFIIHIMYLLTVRAPWLTAAIIRFFLYSWQNFSSKMK